MMKVFTAFLVFFLLQTAQIYGETESGMLSGFKTDMTKHSINTNKIFSGGPGKDGIPALNNAKFTNIKDAKFQNDTLGVLIKIDGTVKFYPYNILVWHEIVNDSIGDTYFTVTFCPLCGSAITFNREFNGRVHRFGVSGFLFESNLLMYDDFTESFWSQAKGEAVVGSYLGKELELINMNVIEFKDLKKNYPDALVLSKDTGHARNYNFYPYGNYEDDKRLYFPTSKSNKKYHPKEIMYVFRYDNRSFVFSLDEFKADKFVYNYNGEEINLFNNDNEISVVINGETIPGYYEMWFSWYIHNEEVGVVIDKIK